MIWKLYNEYRADVVDVKNTIMMQYDAAFAQLKSKQMLPQMLSLAQDPYTFSFFPQTMNMLARWKNPEIETIIMSYFDHPERVKPQLANVLRLDEQTGAAQLQCEYEKWISYGFYTAIVCMRYYPSPMVLEKLRQFEEKTDAEMRMRLTECGDRERRVFLKDRYSDRLSTIRKSIAIVEKSLEQS